MAEEISRPLAEAQKITMVSSGGAEIGAAKLTGEVLDIMTRLPETIEKLTGVSISQVSHTHTCLLNHKEVNITRPTTCRTYSGLQKDSPAL